MLGGEWYEVCSELRVMNYEQIEKATVDKKVKYRECQIEAIRQWCNLNLDGDSEGKFTYIVDTINDTHEINLIESFEKITSKVKTACPNQTWIRLRNGFYLENSPYIIAIKELEKKGEPGFFMQLFPASDMIRNEFLELYPSCESEREKIGLFNNADRCFEDMVQQIRP